MAHVKAAQIGKGSKEEAAHDGSRPLILTSDHGVLLRMMVMIMMTMIMIMMIMIMMIIVASGQRECNIEDLALHVRHGGAAGLWSNFAFVSSVFLLLLLLLLLLFPRKRAKQL